jgi:glycosyltransferase involved in cell wall biosynthesis
MYPLYFPTRYFPAISGGDFFMMRVAKVTGSYFKEDYAIITSDALDFAGLRGEGSKIDEKSKFFQSVHEVNIIRMPTELIENSHINTSKEKNAQNIQGFIQSLDLKQNYISDTAINFFYLNGPYFHSGETSFLEFVYKKFRNIGFHSLDNVDYIFCTYLPYSNLLYSLSLSEKLNIPCYCTPFLHPENPRYDYKAIYEVLEKFDGLFACTNFEKELMIKNGINEKKISIVPMGVDIEKFKRDDLRSNDFLKKYSLTDPFVLFCGNKNYEKGALSLLAALKKLYEKNIKLGAVFIGPNTKAFNAEWKKLLNEFPDRQLVNLTPNNMTGYFDQKKIAAFNECLCYCMVSRSEAYGIAYLEAWACKKPVIAADILAMREVIWDGEDGFLVPFDSPSSLAEKIEYLFKHKAVAVEMGTSGYKKIMNTNQWVQIAQKTRDFIQNQLNQK